MIAGYSNMWCKRKETESVVEYLQKPLSTHNMLAEEDV